MMGIRSLALLSVLVGALVAGAVAAVPQTAAGATDRDGDAAASQPAPGDDGEGARPMSGQRPDEADFDVVARAIAERGSARVIVGLRVDFVPEAQRPPEHAERQRADIARARARLLADLQGTARVARPFDSLPFVALVVGDEALERLRGSQHVASIDLDEPAAPTLAQSTPLHQADLLHADGADGAGTMVAVIDTGVDAAHSAFGDRVVAEACYSTNDASAGSSSLCPGGAGEATGAGAGAHCDVDVLDGCFHGTHVAGIAAGDDDTRGGVAPGADVMAVQVFSEIHDDVQCGDAGSPCILAWHSDIMAGLERVHEVGEDHPIVAANVSLASGQHTAACDDHPMKTAVDSLRVANIATTVATGNQGLSDAVGLPACISTAVAVGSTTGTDEVSGFSNTHPSLTDLYAIGSVVNAPVPGDAFAVQSGSSMAAPQVAGAWALLRQGGSDSVASLLATLQATGSPIDRRETGQQLSFAHGRINIAGAAGLPYRPANRFFAGATTVDELPFTDSQRTWNSVLEDDEPQPGCASSGGMAPSVWYRLVPTGAGTIEADTTGSDFDTLLAVYTGSALDDLDELACDDGTEDNNWTDATVTVDVDAGDTYWLQVAGWSVLARGQAALAVDGDVALDPDPLPDACPPGRVPDAGFTDVAPTSTHAGSIHCVVWWDIARGTSATTYHPGRDVTRGQLASFLAAALEAAGADLGEPGDQGFDDVAGNVHAGRINQLVALGVLRGRSSTEFAPDAPVSRAQQATFLVAGYEHATGTQLPAPSSGFTDIADDPHAGNIDKAAAAEFARGTSATTYSPDQPVVRGQLASFMVNLLTRFVADGHASPPG